MPLEIERKFLIRDDAWRRSVSARQRFCQGYLSHTDEVSVRVRRAGQRAFITIKGGTPGAIRPEFEYEIPLDHAEDMLTGLCHKPLIEKVRHDVVHDGMLWQIDEFADANAGLVLAEIELTHLHQPLALPDWVGEEVTEDPRYRNSWLARNPFNGWR